MFLNYLPSGMADVVGVTMVFAFLVGIILAAMLQQIRVIRRIYILKQLDNSTL